MGFVGDQIKKNYLGGAHSMYEEEERVINGLDGETQGNETIWKTRA
jgi:hypothetical protein